MIGLALALLLAAGPARARCEAPAALRSARHDGRLGAAGIAWETRLALAAPAGPAGACLQLLAPVEGLRVDGAPVPEGSTALEIAPGRRELRLTATQPAPLEGLAPPLPSSPGLHRISLEGARYEPAPDSGVEAHIAFQAEEGVSRAERRALDQRLGIRRSRAAEQPLYVRVPGAGGSGHIAGRVAEGGAVDRGLVRLCGAILVVLLVGAFLAQRGLGRLAEAERRRRENARYLAEELESCPQPPGALSR